MTQLGFLLYFNTHNLPFSTDHLLCTSKKFLRFFYTLRLHLNNQKKAVPSTANSLGNTHSFCFASSFPLPVIRSQYFKVGRGFCQKPKQICQQRLVVVSSQGSSSPDVPPTQRAVSRTTHEPEQPFFPLAPLLLGRNFPDERKGIMRQTITLPITLTIFSEVCFTF